ncbi:MAG: CBS domain-containing protein [Spirochaetia bacterium]|nr:CBS domain-containing protein [Spirochaetia bacterium]
MGNLNNLLFINDFHEVLLESIYTVRVREAMFANPLTIAPDDTMLKAKTRMKEQGMSGIPVVMKTRLVGVLSINDILECLEHGSLDDPVSKYMSRDVVLLEEDMPISFAINYFNKYSFRRFPVINKNKELTGIITARDLTAAMLKNINFQLQKYDKLNMRLGDPEEFLPEAELFRQFIVHKYDFENAGKVTSEIKKILKEKRYPQSIIRRISIAAYELEINLVVHSNGGLLIFQILPDSLMLISRDKGPGIPDLQKALTDGFSTASEWIRSQGFGAGMGLPNVKRVSNDFQISSDNTGTEVKITINKIGNEDESK